MKAGFFPQAVHEATISRPEYRERREASEKLWTALQGSADLEEYQRNYVAWRDAQAAVTALYDEEFARHQLLEGDTP